MKKKNMSMIRTGTKTAIFFFATIALFSYCYMKYSEPAVTPLQKPTKNQLEEFYKLSGIRQNPLAEEIHFEKFPPDEKPIRSDYISYVVVTKFESGKIDEIISDEIFSKSIETDLPPVFIKELDTPKNKGNIFSIYRGQSPGATGLNLTMAIDLQQGKYSYGYYEFIILKGQMKY
jgi:hypothetical protein